MIQRKVIMLGAPSVGKTSLVARFVKGIFSEKYLSTVGVKIDQKDIVLENGEVLRLIIWDVAGESEFRHATANYVRGASACVLVVDGTRRETLTVAQELHTLALSLLEEPVFVVILNKCDRVDAWRLTSADIEMWRSLGCEVKKASALSGEGVEGAFEFLARKFEL